MTGEPMHTASKERMVPELTFSSERVTQLSITEVAIMLCFQLCLAYCTQRTTGEAPLQSIQYG